MGMRSQERRDLGKRGAEIRRARESGYKFASMDLGKGDYSEQDWEWFWRFGYDVKKSPRLLAASRIGANDFHVGEAAAPKRTKLTE